MPPMMMKHEVDPRSQIKKEIGSVDNFEVFNNQVLVAVYIRPEKTKSGIILASQTRDEDRYQSKVGLVLKKGPNAFEETEGNWFKDINVNNDDWIVFRPSDGWQVTVNGVLCRMLDDVNVRGRIDHPDNIW